VIGLGSRSAGGPAAAPGGDWRILLPGRAAGRLLWVGPADRPAPDEPASLDATPVRGVGDLFDPGRRPAEGRFDVVALLASRGRLLRTRANWRAPSVERIAGGLRPGGLLYLEVDRPGAVVRPRTVARRLEQLGFQDIEAYWPVRGFERPDLYLPLGDRRPQRLYVERLLWRGSPLRRLVRIGLRVAIRLDRLGLVVPRYAVVARLGPRPADDPRGAVGTLDNLRRAWPELTGDETVPERIAWLVQPSHTAAGKVICHAWPDDAPTPSAVLKVARGPEGDARVEAEHGALRDLAAQPGEPSIRVPRPLGAGAVEGRAVAAETPIDGRPLTAYQAEHPSSIGSLASRWDPWVDWLADLHLGSGRVSTAEDLDALLFDPLARAGGELALGEAEARALGRLARDARVLLERHPLRVGLAHHDLGPSNILVSEDGRPIGVIDWEVAGAGLPATDLLYFIGRLADGITAARGAVDGWSFDTLFLSAGVRPATPPTTAAGTTARRWLGRYSARTGLHEDWLPILLVACWTMHARNEHRKAPAGAGIDGPFRDRLCATLAALGRETAGGE
jgi:Phosphotransferase enzyme family